MTRKRVERGLFLYELFFSFKSAPFSINNSVICLSPKSGNDNIYIFSQNFYFYFFIKRRTSLDSQRWNQLTYHSERLCLSLRSAQLLKYSDWPKWAFEYHRNFLKKKVKSSSRRKVNVEIENVRVFAHQK